MKNKSVFFWIMTIILVTVICVSLTVIIALLAGSVTADLFNFSNLNISNVIPVFIIGGFITCTVVGIIILFAARSVFQKAKKHFFSETNNKGETKK